jgi:two-component system NarL family response regulator
MAAAWPADPLRILIADDHPVFRAGLVSILEREPDMRVVAQAADGETAVDGFVREAPDVTLMDLRMPGMDGVQAIRAIRRHSADARVVVLTTFDGDEDLYRGLQAGALSYLLKDCPVSDLLHTVREANAGRPVLPPRLTGKLAGRLQAEALSRRELDVLHLLAVGRSNRDIAAALAISEGTVKVHVGHILTKLNAASRTEAVSMAVRRGLVVLS